MSVVELLWVLGIVAVIFLVFSSIPFCCLQRCEHEGVTYLTNEEEERLCKSKYKLRDLRIIGSHNSCHIASLNSLIIQSWRYTHIPILKQLEQGIRHIELDVWFNMTKKRWEVFHESIDKLSNTELLLSDVLKMIHGWSTFHNPHFLLTIFFDIKGQYKCHPLTCACFGRRKNTSLQTGMNQLQALVEGIWQDGQLAKPSQIDEPVCNLNGKSLFMVHQANHYMEESTFFLLMASASNQCCELGDDEEVLKARENGTLVRSLSSKYANLIATDQWPGGSSITLAQPKHDRN